MPNFRNHPLWQPTKNLFLDPLRRRVVRTRYRSHVPLMWCKGENWGDALSPILVEMLSGRSVIHLEGIHHDRYLAIGSILGGANERASVWGSGFIREYDQLQGTPKSVHAVRGPLSRENLLRQGAECPEVYGDPALLLPRFYNPDAEKGHVVGIIPHYIDKDNPWLKKQASDPRVKILDIESGIQEFVREVKSCECILSSSLHGLICADSYGIPNAWIRLSDEVVGGDFKFRDYRASIGADTPKAVMIEESTPLDVLIGAVEKHELKIDLRKLLLACPFLSTELRVEVLQSDGDSCGLPLSFKSAQLHSSSLTV
ncbi:MAG: polysaccharide pyruvyl transferase family protein [Proteobacteria bacterium]|nr:MAG: polysaccharide pyruvyl transferase family protein [Pseudomonadota bacterium]